MSVTTQSLPTYHLCTVQGTPFERGRAYGKWVRPLLVPFLEEQLYQCMAERRRRGRTEMRAYAEACLPYLEREAPRTWAFLQGLSETSGLGVVELVVILAHEEYDHGHSLVPHCTGFAATAHETLDGHVYIGQNWDWIGANAPYRHLVHQTTEAGQHILTYAYPGLWASAGLTSAGFGLTWVGAGYGYAEKHHAQARPGVPSYALIAELLEQATFEEAVQYVMEATHAGWLVFLLASSDGKLARIEASPTAKACHRPRSLMAANIIYTDEAVRQSVQQEEEGALLVYWPKYARMCQLLLSYSGRLTRDLLLSFMRGHLPDLPNHSTCEHGERGWTLDGMLFSPTAQKAWFLPGPPCTSDKVHEYAL
jgi:hypothetical protein